MTNYQENKQIFDENAVMIVSGQTSGAYLKLADSRRLAKFSDSPIKTRPEQFILWREQERADSIGETTPAALAQ